MEAAAEFVEVLSEYVNRSDYSLGQLARLSGLPKTTIATWLGGRVRRPQQWQGLLRLAVALHLDREEASRLLRAAGHPPVEELLALAGGGEERELLVPWSGAAPERAPAPPFQAIADLPYFVGREEELRSLERAMRAGRAVAIYSLEGMGGMGKTALAARLAYALRPHFPDGVLWARMDTSDPMSVLSTFAAAYGRDVGQYPDLDSRSRVVRELLADKRALIVLDNVASSQQAAPLLPPSGACVVLITTRRHDLSVTRGAYRLHLRRFSREKGEALALFARILGQERAAQERKVLLEIADLLGHLPQAVGIAASRLAYEPGWSAAGFLERLRQEQRRLAELVYEDQNVRLSFSFSYDALAPGGRRFFATLGVFGGEDFGPEAAAELAGLSAEEAQDALRSLYGLSLVQGGRPGRYRLHPLLRDFARLKLEGDAPFERMVAYFAGYAERHARDYAALDAEASNLLAALETGFERGLAAPLIRGVLAFYPFLETRGLYDLAGTHLARAEAAARAAGDEVSLAGVLLYRGQLARQRGDYAAAQGYLAEALGLAHRTGHQKLLALLLCNLGDLSLERADHARAETYLEKGLAVAGRAGDQEITCYVLRSFGLLAAARGDDAGAQAYLDEALALARRVGHPWLVAELLIRWGDGRAARGELEAAAGAYEEALELARAPGFRELTGLARYGLARVAAARGEADQAREHGQAGLAILGSLDHRRAEEVAGWLERLAARPADAA